MSADARLTAIREAGYLAWHKSMHSLANGNCVEVAAVPGTVCVQDSKTLGAVLRFSPAAWRAFTDSIDWG